MIQDKRGNELHEGDIVGVLFEVTNVVADSERLNLLVRHASPHHGLPDDWRLQLSSSQVELVEAAPRPEPVTQIESAAPAPVQAQPEATAAE